MVRMPLRFRTLAMFAVALPLALARGQAPRQYTAADYDKAVKFLAPALNGLVVGGVVNAGWQPDDRFWYRNAKLAGDTEIVVIDPARKTRVACPAAPQPTECGGVPIPAAGAAGARTRRTRGWSGRTRRGRRQRGALSRRNQGGLHQGTGISGCAMSRPTRRSSSRPTA